MTSLPHRRRFPDTTVTRLESPPRTPSGQLTCRRLKEAPPAPGHSLHPTTGLVQQGTYRGPTCLFSTASAHPGRTPTSSLGSRVPVSASERRSPRGRASHRPPTAGTSAPRLSLPSGCGLHDTENAERPLHSPEAAAAHCTCNEVRAPPGPPRGGPAPWPLPLSPGACPLCWPRGTTAVPSLCPGHPSSTGRRP